MTSRWLAVPRQLYSLTPQEQGQNPGRSLAEAKNAVTWTTATGGACGTLPACTARRGAGSERAFPSAIPAGSDCLVFVFPALCKHEGCAGLLTAESELRAGPGCHLAPFGRAVHEEVSSEAGAGGRGLWESQRLRSVRRVRVMEKKGRQPKEQSCCQGSESRLPASQPYRL